MRLLHEPAVTVPLASPDMWLAGELTVPMMGDGARLTTRGRELTTRTLGNTISCVPL